jgi:hypothetical protein
VALDGLAFLGPVVFGQEPGHGHHDRLRDANHGLDGLFAVLGQRDVEQKRVGGRAAAEQLNVGGLPGGQVLGKNSAVGGVHLGGGWGGIVKKNPLKAAGIPFSITCLTGLLNVRIRKNRCAIDASAIHVLEKK